MTPDTAARDALAAALRAMGLFKSRAFAEGAADAILADLATRGYVLHPVTCPGPLDAETLARALRTAGFEPDFNICASCGHSGGDHDLGNWCLLCPRPDVPARPIDGRLAAGWCFYSSMTHSEKWEHGAAAILAALPKPAP